MDAFSNQEQLFLRLSSWVIRFPKYSILIPASIAFTLSYPLLYSLLNENHPIFHHNWSTSTVETPQLAVHQAIIYPPANASSSVNQALVDALQPLLEELNNSPGRLPEDSLLDNVPYFHGLTNISILEDFDSLMATKLVLRARKSKKRKASPQGLLLSYVEHVDSLENDVCKDPAIDLDDLENDQLEEIKVEFETSGQGMESARQKYESEYEFLDENLVDAREDNELSDVASALSIDRRKPNENYLNSSDKQANVSANNRCQATQSLHNMRPWNKGLSKLLSNPPPSPPSIVLTQKPKEILVTLVPGCPLMIAVLCLLLSTFSFYCLMVMADFRAIYSRLGIAFAFVVQCSLALSSSASIVSMFYSGFPLHLLRQYMILPFILILLSGSLTFKMMTILGSKESTSQAWLAQQVVELIPWALKKTAFTCAVLGIAYVPFLRFPEYAKALCLFGLLSAAFNLMLYLTFFTAILTVDLRLKEEAVLNLADEYTNDSLNLSSTWRLQAYLYIRYFFDKRISPPSVSFLFVVYLYLGSNGWLGQFVAENINVTLNNTPLFLNAILDGVNVPSLQVYSPLVLYCSSDYSSFRWEFFSALSARRLAFYFFSDIGVYKLLLEFVALLVLLISLSLAILRMYSNPTEEEVSWDVVTPKKEHFHCKDLIGYHLLDIIRITGHGSHIVTVSTDHKAYVWDVIGRNGKMLPPFLIPLASNAWPISHIMLDSVNGRVGVLSSRIPIINVWKYGPGTLECNFVDKSVYNCNAVESFFTGGDLIVVTSNNRLVSLTDKGNPNVFIIEQFERSNSKIVACKRILTPRLPERIVCLSSQSELVVGTRLGKDWRFRKLMFGPELGANGSEIGVERISAVVPVPALNMLLISTSLRTILIDVHTGTILRKFHLGHLQKGSLKVFHADPAHCIFCGCASVNSFSVAYNGYEDPGMVICHSLVIENRGRSNICCRSERDPREVRCLSFDQVTERQHWIKNVEGWDTIDMNMIMGIRRKELPIDSKEEKPRSLPSLRRRNKCDSTGLTTPKRTPPIGGTWEGWAMSAYGQVSYYDIPESPQLSKYADLSSNGLSTFSRLLIQRAGPVTAFGHKSIAVAFGNILKVLYFGNEEKYIVTTARSSSESHIQSSRKWKRGGRAV